MTCTMGLSQQQLATPEGVLRRSNRARNGDCCVQAVTFIHAHRSSQHSPDMLTELKRLKWEAVPGCVLESLV